MALQIVCARNYFRDPAQVNQLRRKVKFSIICAIVSILNALYLCSINYLTTNLLIWSMYVLVLTPIIIGIYHSWQLYQCNTEFASDTFLTIIKPQNVSYSKFEVDFSLIDEWTTKFLNWMSAYIFDSLLSELRRFNDDFSSMGLEGVLFESRDAETWKQIKTSIPAFKDSFPSIQSLLPFFDVPYSCEIMVKRIRELARGYGMPHYQWNNVVTVGTNESDKLTDASMIMHFFGTYINLQSLAQPDIIKWSFCKLPDLPKIQEDSIIVYQKVIYPPHYVLILGHEVYDGFEGPRNLFYIMMLLLQYVKLHTNGILGGINLDLDLHLLNFFDSDSE